MKNLLAAILILAATTAYADFSSTWILQRTIITDEHKVFDTSLDDHILIGGVMKVVNDEYELKGLMCDERTNECMNIIEELQILEYGFEKTRANVEDPNDNQFTVHILYRLPNSYSPLNLFFTDPAWGSTVTHSFRLIAHHEEEPVYEHTEGMTILEGEMALEQIYLNQ